MKAVFKIVVAAAMAAGATTASAADYVILESDAAGIEPGIVVAAGADIAVPEGASIVMIDPNGQTVAVEGPYSGPIASAGTAGGASAIERLTTAREQDTKVLGAVRGVTVQGGSVNE